MFSRFNKYLDYASITPVDRGVLRVMYRVMKYHFHNPGSLYAHGVKAQKFINNSRKSIAKNLNCHQDEIVFTSGGTESNNIAIQGVVDKWYENHGYDYTVLPHIIITEIEHPAVKNVVENLSKKKRITFSKIKVDESGVINLYDLKQELLKVKDVILVSIMMVNNEIGTIQPIRDIAAVVRKAKGENIYPLLHTDACQAVNHIDISLDRLGVDMMTVDAGKFYGPHGAGLLYVKRNTPVNPVFFGGDQERGLRPGTENISAIVGIDKALEIVKKNKAKEINRLYKMQQYVFDKVSKMKDVSVNGSMNSEERVVNNINICFKGKDAEFLLFKLDKLGYEVSTGTTCQNKKEESRSVSVDALGGDCGGSSLRISLGRGTSWGSVRGLVRALRKVSK